ncbi:MAG: 16S rRNA (adenine(1518)-N(6)/adenine(1519)-N(6))-dimethyltransferase RsmA [Atopobiaceae bacterium]|nr:16S rRNA (adenine(1518)-N(6)/adenine(1519)-N(6))-dimethyltransferase RsmA [Atopobiaceae bacterium]
MPYSYLANPRETRAVLERYGLAPRHRLGQNFLVNDDVIRQIVALAELDENDVVYEVGPGIGTLTVALLSRVKRVVAVEADRSLPDVLAETCAQDGERLSLVRGDALRVDAAQLSEAAGSAPNKLVSNLPYQVAATLILNVLEHMPSIERMVVMVQAEVADRIAARPGGKEYGAYTAKLALFGQVTGRFEVGPGNFMPPPHVDSAVVRIDRNAAACADPARVATIIDAAFAQRRKTIRNSMVAKGFEKAVLDEAFARADIDPRTRAEKLAPEDFMRLAEALTREDGTSSLGADSTS